MPDAPSLSPRNAAELPAWLWLWVPPAVLILDYAAAVYDPRFERHWFGSEEGVLEWATIVLLFPAIACGAAVWRKRRMLPGKWPALWILCMTLTAFYFAGEELSWGQKIFNWQSPEFFMQANDQQETNLHNISSWFDQKPRILFTVWVLVGGIIVPLRTWNSPGWSTANWRYWFWPTRACLPVCLLAIALQFPEHVKDWLGVEALRYEIRYSEVQEFYFATFLLLYLASVYVRLSRRSGGGASRHPESSG